MNKNVLIDLIKTHLENDISIDDITKELTKYICPLTRGNADIIETCIANDPHYSDSMSPVLRNLNIYRNNSTIQTINERLTRRNLEDFVWKVAIANSIQGKRQIVKINMASFILRDGQSFYERLKNGDWHLVEEMDSYVFEQCGERHECSWCSKDCKFLHEYLFNEDKYYIYDNNVKIRLNEYRRHYGLIETPNSNIDVYKNRDWYHNLCSSLDELKTSLLDALTRYEIDHILWGFQKYNVELERL